MRIGCGCLLVLFVVGFGALALVIGYRDRERQRRCDEALGGQVARQVTFAGIEGRGGGALTLELLGTDATWLNWPSYTAEVAAHIKGGGKARLAWTDSDTIGVLLFDREGRAVSHVCFVT